MIAWMDVETTGLNEKKHHLLEVAIVVTDDNLVERASTSVVMQPEGCSIDEVEIPLSVREMHEKSGLLADVRKTTNTRASAMLYLIAWLVDLFVQKDDLKKVPLAGSTIDFDRRFTREQMFEFEQLFSYRSINVSTLVELADRWAPDVHANRPKVDKRGKAHRGADDIRVSIDYLKYFRATGFLNTRQSVREQVAEHLAYFNGRCPFMDCDTCARK
jgi:oligoribonuclease